MIFTFRVTDIQYQNARTKILCILEEKGYLTTYDIVTAFPDNISILEEDRYYGWTWRMLKVTDALDIGFYDYVINMAKITMPKPVDLRDIGVIKIDKKECCGKSENAELARKVEEFKKQVDKCCCKIRPASDFGKCEDINTYDPVSKPAHYAEGRKYEPRKVIHDWGLNFNLGNAVKYISRAGRKNDAVEDLKKAIRYIEFELEEMEGSK